ncbi:hypothetical protein EYF80_054028 [Liparis tanakae]|uniref:Uncharacterized protein n=1 Tax=Liparis tanakae TaxID=230148 RepID=A0A4Z2F4K0_9TELE|nr:hypothetical protein EYF80_054028 [Liparis tanakae]
MSSALRNHPSAPRARQQARRPATPRPPSSKAGRCAEREPSVFIAARPDEATGEVITCDVWPELLARRGTRSNRTKECSSLLKMLDETNSAYRWNIIWLEPWTLIMLHRLTSTCCVYTTHLHLHHMITRHIGVNPHVAAVRCGTVEERGRGLFLVVSSWSPLPGRLFLVVSSWSSLPGRTDDRVHRMQKSCRPRSRPLKARNEDGSCRPVCAEGKENTKRCMSLFINTVTPERRVFLCPLKSNSRRIERLLYFAFPKQKDDSSSN